MACGWRIPFILGLGVGLGGIAIRRYYVERVPHQPPAKSPLDEAFRSHWRTMLHLIALVAGLSVGFYTTFVYSATWLQQVAGVPARTALGINTVAMALSLLASLAAGWRATGSAGGPCWSVGAGALALLAYPLMALMARGQRAALSRARSGSPCWSRPAAAPCRPRWPSWRRGGCAAPCSRWRTTWAWRCSAGPRRWWRRGWSRGPGCARAGGVPGRGGGVDFVGALLLPRTAPHRLTKEFEAARYR